MLKDTQAEVTNWQQLREVFDEAAALAPARRDEYLVAVCGRDQTLRNRLDRLLAVHDDFCGTDALPSGVDGVTRAWDSLSALSVLQAGQRVGDFRIDGLLGEGGMGSVYMASREVDAQTQRVALKVASQVLRDARTVDQLRHERSILATLDHPGIARLVDAGELADGRPFFAMEYVDGVAITRYCDEHRLDLRARLALFASVCEAVTYAHRRLVLHRDLKPGNILVDSTGRARLLDFGIAKTLMIGTNAIADCTVDGRFFSPHCAAPEQVSGKATTVATDVYGLGCLLYELLSGRQPFDFSSSTREHVLWRICEEMPPSPSESVRVGIDADMTGIASRRGHSGQQALVATLRGDLDAIVMTALRKRPDERYATVDELMADVRCVIDSRPIGLRSRDRWYRARCFVRRHRVSVGIATTLGLVTLAMIGIALMQSVRVSRERDRAVAALAVAEMQRDHARGVTQFLVDAFGAADPLKARGRDLRAAELFTAAADLLAKRSSQAPALRATIAQTLSHLFFRLDMLPETVAQATVAKQALADIRDAPAELVARQQLAEAESAFAQNRFSDTIAAAAQGLGLLAADPALAEGDLLYGLMLMKGLGHIGTTDTQGAVDTFRAGIAALSSRHDTPPARIDALTSQLAGTISDQGDHAQARDILLDLLASQRTRMTENDPPLNETKQKLAAAYLRLGQIEPAEQYSLEALDAFRQMFGEHHLPTVRMKRSLANVYSDNGRIGEAEQLYRQAIATGETHGGAQGRLIAGTQLNLGMLYRDIGDWKRAESAFRTALRLFAKEQRFNLAYTERQLAETLMDSERHFEAEYYLRRALPVVLELYGECTEANYLRADLAYVRLRRFDFTQAREWLSSVTLTDVRVYSRPDDVLRKRAETVAATLGIF